MSPGVVPETVAAVRASEESPVRNISLVAASPPILETPQIHTRSNLNSQITGEKQAVHPYIAADSMSCAGSHYWDSVRE